VSFETVSTNGTSILLDGSAGVKSIAISTLHWFIEKLRQKFINLSISINSSTLIDDVTTCYCQCWKTHCIEASCFLWRFVVGVTSGGTIIGLWHKLPRIGALRSKTVYTSLSGFYAEFNCVLNSDQWRSPFCPRGKNTCCSLVNSRLMEVLRKHLSRLYDIQWGSVLKKASTHSANTC